MQQIILIFTWLVIGVVLRLSGRALRPMALASVEFALRLDRISGRSVARGVGVPLSMQTSWARWWAIAVL